MTGAPPPPPAGGTLPRAAALLVAVGALLVQRSGFRAVKMAAKSAGLRGDGSASAGDLLRTASGALGWPAWLGLALLALGAGTLLVAEIRGRAVSRALRDLSLGRAGWLLPLVGFVSVLCYLDAGVPHAFDAKQHWTKIATCTEILADGEWPGWTFRWYGGMPLLRFYGPVLYLAAGGLGVLAGSAASGLKILLVVAHLGSAMAIFAFVRRLTGSRGAAGSAALVHLLAVQRYHSLLVLGRLPEAALWFLFPLLLLSVERFAARPGPRAVAVTGLLLGAMLLSHPVMGTVGALVAGLYALVRLSSLGWWRRSPAGLVGYGAGAGALAVGLAAFWLVPAMRERPHVLLREMYGGPSSALPAGFSPGNLVALLAWPPGAAGHGAASYQGFVPLLLAGFGLVAGLRTASRRPAAVPLLAATALVLLYAGGGYFSGRAVLYLAPLVAVAAGMGVAELVRRRPSGLPGMAGLALLLVLVDLVPWAVRSPFRPDFEALEADLLDVRRDNTAKTVIASRRDGRIQVSQWTGWDQAGTWVLGGPFREAATDVYPWYMATLAMLEDDLQDGGPLRRETVGALLLAGVGRIVVDGGDGLEDPPVDPGEGYRLVAHAGLLPDSGPPAVVIEGGRVVVQFASRAETVAPPDAAVPTDLPGPDSPWRRLLSESVARHMDPPPDGGRRSILLREPVPEGTGGTWPEGELAGFRTSSSDVRRREVTFLINTLPCDVYVLLAVAHYPGVTAEVDGRPVEILRSQWGHVVVPVPQGAKEVRVLGPSGPRSGPSGWLSVAALLLAVVPFVVRFRPRIRAGAG